jgi:hypothetical protein
MRMFFLSVLCCIWFIPAGAQIIPLTRSSEWNRAGSDFSFPEPDTILNVLDFGATGDGISDDRPAIQNAINAMQSSYRVVFIPAGTYLLLSPLTLKDSVIIRGAGSDSTFLKIHHSGNGFVCAGGSPGTFTNVMSGLERGSQKIRVANPSLFSKGSYSELRQENGAWDTSPATWATYSVGQIVRVDSVAGDTLFLQDPLRIDYDSVLNPQIRTFIPRVACSIECLHVERTDGNTAGTGHSFNFNFAVNCRLAGVESNKSQGSHCMIGLSSRITVSGCYFHNAYVYDGSGTKGYGVTMNNHAGLCLIMNNIFKYLRHAMMTKHGANGNVFAYNYSRETFRNGQFEFPQDYCGDISLHGHYSFANLFEGNMVQTVYIDEYWGPSGPHNTFFRNRIEHYGLIMTSAQTHDQNFVGNEITGTGYTFPFSHGAYTLTGTGHLEYGNNDNGVIVPAGTSILNDNSCFLTAQPVFWNIASAWPSIGAPNAPGSGDIPARARWLSGQYTDCSQPGIYTGNHSIVSKRTAPKAFPNPFSHTIYIDCGTLSGSVSVELFDGTGRKILRRQFEEVPHEGLLQIPVVPGLPRGLYMLRIQSNEGIDSMIVVKG